MPTHRVILANLMCEGVSDGWATTVLDMLHWLGIKPSYSRPRVSDDNAFIEALFRTTKHRPHFQSKGFEGLDTARRWVREFVSRFNHEHCHSAIRRR